jgi:hypothetical protein
MYLRDTSSQNKSLCLQPQFDTPPLRNLTPQFAGEVKTASEYVPIVFYGDVA